MMSEVYATVQLGREQDNTQLLGVIVAFLASRDLLDNVLVARHGSAVARLKMQDLKGAEFLTTVLDGELCAEHCNELGRAFCKANLQGEAGAELAAMVADSQVQDWQLFDELLPKMSQSLRALAAPKRGLKQLAAKVLQFPTRKR